MAILDRKTLNRVMVNVPTGGGVFPVRIEQHDEISGTPPGENSTIAETEYIDEVGSAVKADTPVAWCATANKPVALWNVFLCAYCHRYHGLCYLAAEAPDAVALAPATGSDPSVVSRPATASAPAVRRGVCRTCYDAAKMSRFWAAIGLVFLALGRFVMAPFLPVPSSSQPNVPTSARVNGGGLK